MEKNILFLIIVTLVAKIVAFGKEVLLANYLGASMASDVYIMSMIIPVTFFGIVSTGITTGYIPIYKKLCEEDGEQAGIIFTNKILSLLLIVCLIFIAVYFIFRHNIINIFASGFSDTAKAITIKYTNISIFAILFSCITCVINAFLQSNGGTIFSGVLSVPLNIVIVASILASYYLNNYFLLPMGYLFACFVQCITFLYITTKYTYNVKLNAHLHDRNIISFVKNIGILTIGSSVNQINVLIDKMLASNVTTGGVASFEYGNRIIDLISGIIILSITTVQYPKMAQNSYSNGKLLECTENGILGLLAILSPITLIVIAYSTNIVKLIYGRGAFDSHAVSITSSVVFFYGIGLLAIGLREILSRVFYAQLDMRTPIINSTIGMTMNIVLNFMLVKHLGIGGLALATSLAAFTTTILLYVQLAIKFKGVVILKAKKQIFGPILVSMITIGISKIFFHFSINYIPENTSFILATFTHCIIYIILIVKLHVVKIGRVSNIGETCH